MLCAWPLPLTVGAIPGACTLQSLPGMAPMARRRDGLHGMLQEQIPISLCIRLYGLLYGKHVQSHHLHVFIFGKI